VLPVLRANLAAVDLPGGRVVAGSVPTVLAGPAPARFDLVLADPPYAFDGWATLLDRLPAPLAVLESDRPVDPGAGWSAHSKRYGDSVVTLARRL